MISWRNYSYRYPSGRGIAPLTLDVQPGEAVLFCGPSGGGKSTVLRSVSGIVPQLHGGECSGEVRVGEIDPATAPLADVGVLVGNVFQDPQTAFFTTRVRDELAFGAENMGHSPSRINARVDEVLGEYELTGLQDRGVGKLSAGERQRVACACTAVTRPTIICLDEPTSNLDPDGIGELRDHLLRLKASGSTLLLAEHRVSHLRGVVDRVCVVRDGRTQSVVPAAEFWAWSDDACRTAGIRSLTPVPFVPATPLTEQAPIGRGLHGRCLRFDRGAQTVIDVPEFFLARGQVHALVGPNGSGKTTLARLLCGLEKPRAGTICLDGQVLGLRERRRRIALVMHELHRQVARSTVSEELAHVPDPDALLEDFGLSGLGARHPLSLSGGQLQRLVVASAVAGGADVLIFDEPTSGLDLPSMQRTATQLRLLAERGCVVLVITHDAELVRACADRVLDARTLRPTPRQKAFV